MKVKNLESFILEHENEDTSRLLLSKSKWPDIDMDRAVTAIECRKRIKHKLPSWYAEPSILYPDRICTEQCSSEETARYKAEIIGKIIGNCRLADLTGGLGVDSAAFSNICSRVLYNEMDPKRAAAAEHNFKALGISNVSITSSEITPGCDYFSSVLAEFHPDIIYLDPARRSSSGNKVFLLEECLPDVLSLIPDILSITPNLLLKLSPMADISMIIRRLESNRLSVKDVHCVSSDGECKELLVYATGFDSQKQCNLTIYENGKTKTFSSDEEKQNTPILMDGEDKLTEKKYLFEPGKSLSKAGLFNTISHCYPFPTKAGIHTHLYFLDRLPNEGEESITDFGKLFEIISISSLNKQNITKLGKEYRNCEVTSRNLRMSSEELRKKLKSSSGGDVHIFGIRVDFNSSSSCKKNGDNYLVVTRRVR